MFFSYKLFRRKQHMALLNNGYIFYSLDHKTITQILMIRILYSQHSGTRYTLNNGTEIITPRTSKTA
jgi:hypothetical protein